MTLHLYFARRFMMSFLGVTGVFLLMIFFIDIVEHLRQFGNDDIGMVSILVLVLLNAPRAMSQIMPLIMILSAITLFLSLARSSELVVTRAAGRSAMRALLSPLAVTVALGVFFVGVLNPIVAGTSKAYESRTEALRGDGSVLAIGSGGLWLRQGDGLAQTVIHAERSNLDGTVLGNVTFVTFTAEGKPVQRINARSASLTPGAWVLREAKVWPLDTAEVPEQLAEMQSRFDVPSTLTPAEIRNSFGAPYSIPIWALPDFIDRLNAAGFSAQRHLVWFHSELALPVFLVAMVMIGAVFTLRHQRGGRTGMMVLFAVLLAFVTYFVRNFTQVLGENGELPVLLAVWTPPLAAIGLSLGLLLHNEDG